MPCEVVEGIEREHLVIGKTPIIVQEKVVDPRTQRNLHLSVIIDFPYASREQPEEGHGKYLDGLVIFT